MRDSIVEFKVKIFISSKCGGKYTIVRKALKEMLLNTDMTEVYTFETASGSSQAVIESYLHYVNESHLCIFIIDNKDGVSDPVLAEQKRAKTLNKKLIYIFCDEEEKQPTQLQNEIKENFQEKFCVVHEFSDITEKAFQSVMQDIVDTYKLKEGIHAERSNSANESNVEVTKVDTYKMNKNTFKGFDLTKNELVKIVSSFTQEVKDTSELDKLCKNFLQAIIGTNSFNEEEFESLKNLVIEKHSKELKNLIELRLNAVKYYFTGKLNECLCQLDLALDEASKNHNIPNWITNDIAIDIRNTQGLLDEMESRFTIDNKGQKLLNENSEPLFYPLIDRIENNINEDLLKKHFSFNTDSPYTTSFGGLEELFKNIAYCFYVAIIYGSITHIKMTRSRLIEVLKTLCAGYSDHDLYVELMKMLVLNLEDKDIEKIIRTYNQSVDIVNSVDIDSIISSTETLPLPHQRIKAKCLALKYFGYYFTDKQYNTVFNEVYDYINVWVKDNKRIFNMAQYFCGMFKGITHRINNDKIVKFIINVFSNNLRRWFDEACELISYINFKNVSEEFQLSLLAKFVSYVNNEEERKNISRFNDALIHFRNTSSVGMKLLDDAVKKSMTDFFDNMYTLEIFNHEESVSFNFIQKYIDIIHNQNEEQGKNGIYYGYGNDAYRTIRNIIEYNNIQLEWSKIIIIIDALFETIVAKNQEIHAKNSAILLIIYLRNKFTNNQGWQDYIDKISISKDIILTGKEIGMFEKDTLSLLQLNFTLLLICFGKCDKEFAINTLISANQLDDYETIQALQYIDELLINAEYSKIDSLIIAFILQFASAKSYHKERDIRFFAVKCLIQLTHSPYQKLALEQLSKIMDTCTSEIKIAIISRAKQIETDDKTLINYIIQKGKVDNNYLVRKAASELV